jgi:hypothetical protein
MALGLRDRQHKPAALGYATCPRLLCFRNGSSNETRNKRRSAADVVHNTRRRERSNATATIESTRHNFRPR